MDRRAYSLAYSLWSHKELDTTERLTLSNMTNTLFASLSFSNTQEGFQLPNK